MKKCLDQTTLNRALALVGELLDHRGAPPIGLVVCGGAALIATGLVARTTKDVDVVAFSNSAGRLLYAEPLPPRRWTPC